MKRPAQCAGTSNLASWTFSGRGNATSICSSSTVPCNILQYQVYVYADGVSRTQSDIIFRYSQFLEALYGERADRPGSPAAPRDRGGVGGVLLQQRVQA